MQACDLLLARTSPGGPANDGEAPPSTSSTQMLGNNRRHGELSDRAPHPVFSYLYWDIELEP